MLNQILRVLWVHCVYYPLQTFCLNESPWLVCSCLCYYSRLPHWLFRSDAFWSGEPGSMSGQLAGCRSGRHVLSIDSLECLHSKSLPLPTDTIKVNSIKPKKIYQQCFFWNLIWNNPLKIISLCQSKNGKNWIFVSFFLFCCQIWHYFAT